MPFTINNLRLRLSVALLSLLLVRFSAAQENQSFLNPPRIIDNPSTVDNYKPGSREFTGIPSLTISPGGRLWAVWYAGKTSGEDKNNYVVLSTSNDEGDTWKETMVIDPDGDGPARAFDAQVWIDPDGKLWVFWTQSVDVTGTIAGVWSMTTKDPDTENPKWSEPKRLRDGVMMCKPLVLSTGEWVLPISTWKTSNSAKMIVSEDKGKSWQERGAVDIPEKARTYDEHMIVERKDSSLWMLVRTKYGIGESRSTNRGKSWSPLVPSKIMHPSARFFIRKLKSENLLLVKHGPVEMKTHRSHLMAFISKDDGESWSKGLLLDERSGVSYPDGQQLNDGRILLTYDYRRMQNENILLTSFTEEDILSGDYDAKIIEVFRRRKLISDGGEKNPEVKY